MYIIKEGEVDVSLRTRPDAEHAWHAQTFHVGVIGPGSWFGERPLLTGEKNDFSYSTVSRCSAFAIGIKLFAQIRRRVSSVLTQELSAKLKHRCEHMCC